MLTSTIGWEPDRNTDFTGGTQLASLLPLDGFTIGVTADRRCDEQTELLTRLGAQVLLGPSVHTRTLVADDALRSVTSSLIRRPPAVVVATTGVGIRSWFSAAAAWGLDEALASSLARGRIVARGPKSLGALRSLGLPVAWSEGSERLEPLLDRLCPSLGARQRVAFQADGGDSSGPLQRIAGTGADPVEVRSYRSGYPHDRAPALRLVQSTCDRRLDALTFTSPPAVDNLFALAEQSGLGPPLRHATNTGTRVACVGPATAQAARRAGVMDPVFPGTGRLGLLARVLVDALGGRRRELRAPGAHVVIQGATVRIDGENSVTLTDRERSLLECLVDSAGAVVSSDCLVRAVWGDGGNTHLLDVTLARLRGRLGPAGAAVHRVRGRGLWIEAADVRKV